MNGAKYSISDNVYVKNNRRGIYTFKTTDQNNRIINSYAENSDGIGLRVQNKNHLVENNWVVSTKDVNMDYYISMYGGGEGSGNIFINNYINRYSQDSHSGHGIIIRTGAEGNKAELNLIENNILQNTGIQLEQFETRDNIVRNNKIDNARIGAISFLNGGSHNTIEGVEITNALFAFRWVEGPGGGVEENGHHNIITNCVVKDTHTLLGVGIFQVDHIYPEIRDNTIQNCVFHNVEYIYVSKPLNTAPYEPEKFTSTNVIKNSIFSNVKNQGKGLEEITYSNNAYYDVGISIPKTNNNIELNPQFVNEAAGDFTTQNPTLKEKGIGLTC